MPQSMLKSEDLFLQVVYDCKQEGENLTGKVLWAEALHRGRAADLNCDFVVIAVMKHSSFQC